MTTGVVRRDGRAFESVQRIFVKTQVAGCLGELEKRGGDSDTVASVDVDVHMI
jgi:hypothetical protein